MKSLTGAALRRKIEAATRHKVTRAHIHCAHEDWDTYIGLLNQIWPDCEVKERQVREVGCHSVNVQIRCEFGGDYWRSLAKIAFHYYLVTNRSGYIGSERHFAPIRDYLLGKNSDHRAVFERVPQRFLTTGGELGDGTALLPTTWHHMLAYNDHNGEVVAGVQLFMGPERPAPMHTVYLGSYRSRIIVPSSTSAHIYEYRNDAGSSYDGQVRPMPLRRID